MKKYNAIPLTIAIVNPNKQAPKYKQANPKIARIASSGMSMSFNFILSVDIGQDNICQEYKVANRNTRYE